MYRNSLLPNISTTNETRHDNQARHNCNQPLLAFANCAVGQLGALQPNMAQFQQGLPELQSAL